MAQGKEQRRLQRIASAFNTKSRNLGVSGYVTAQDLAIVALAYPACPYCGVELEIGQGSFDHQNPLDLGGPNTRDNLVRCCFMCQRTKFTKTPEELRVFAETVFRCDICRKVYRPRYTDWVEGKGRTCSKSCAATKRWADQRSSGVPVQGDAAGEPAERQPHVRPAREGEAQGAGS